jgi:serine phosphatase RsbU (regulator of sigma subunit)
MKDLSHIEEKMRQPFWKSWALYVIIISGLILSVMLYRLSNDIESLSRKSLNKAVETTVSELNNFFSPFVQNLRLAREWGSSGQLDIGDIEAMNRRFVPVLRNYTQITSMLTGRSDGSEYMLLNEDTAWVNRKTRFFPEKEVRKLRWLYRSNRFEKVYDEIWTDRKDYDPRLRPWFRGALSDAGDSIPAWTKPYTFATTGEPGITASFPYTAGNDTTTCVIAYDLKLFDISLFTSRLAVSDSGKLFILTEDTLVIGLPHDRRFITSGSIKQFILKPIDTLAVDEMSVAFHFWGKQVKSSDAFRFSSGGEEWWGRFVDYPLNPTRKLLIGVVVPESDFVSEVKQTRNIILMGFGLVFILTLVIVSNYNQKRRANILLAQQKAEIEHKNELLMQANEEIQAQKEEIEQQRDIVMDQRDHITEQKKEIEDSIRYAKRIQNAVLPDADYAKKILKEHFILFRPKDVVSGDFYWATQINDWLIVAAADCTGHGVPGAFMSMLGMSFLNEIVRKKEVTSAAEILNHLRASVVEALRQTGESGTQKDGMDISLVTICARTQTYYWAGANNPLWILRAENIGKEAEDAADLMEEIKPDKMPVAIHEKMDPFTNHQISLKSGDRIYMFSDGMPDQFGGPRGKKYLYKTLRRLMVNTASLPVKEQGEALGKAFDEWIHFNGTHYEQTDDVTIIGIEI